MENNKRGCSALRPMSIKVYRMSEPRKRVNMMRMADLTTAFPVGHVLLKRGNRHLNI